MRSRTVYFEFIWAGFPAVALAQAGGVNKDWVHLWFLLYQKSERDVNTLHVKGYTSKRQRLALIKRATLS